MCLLSWRCYKLYSLFLCNFAWMIGYIELCYWFNVIYFYEIFGNFIIIPLEYQIIPYLVPPPNFSFLHAHVIEPMSLLAQSLHALLNNIFLSWFLNNSWLGQDIIPLLLTMYLSYHFCWIDLRLNEFIHFVTILKFRKPAIGKLITSIYCLPLLPWSIQLINCL